MILSDVPIDFGFDDVADLVEWVQYFLISIPLNSNNSFAPCRYSIIAHSLMRFCVANKKFIR